MTQASAGLHHITAICGDPAVNAAFYMRVLGMRQVKKTVNFDDPSTYHLYYGDETGAPGTALTFFPYTDAPQGRHGTGAPVEIALAVPPAALAFWADRLAEQGVAFERRRQFRTAVLAFADPHGVALQIVGTPWADTIDGWTGGPVPAEHAIRGFEGAGVWVDDADGTAAALEDVLGFAPVDADDDRLRFQAGDGNGPGAVIDLRVNSMLAQARQGVGSIHHIAFRAADDAQAMARRDALASLGLDATPQIDRQYFRSIYFREPGGALFEIATDGPGFTVDEPVEHLGETLQLPPQHEPRRTAIEAALPTLA